MDAVLCIRPRPGDADPRFEPGGPVVATGREWPLAPLLHAVDAVVTLSSTVGLEGHLAGTRVVQIIGTPFDDATPWLRFGIADLAVPLDAVCPALEEVLKLPRRQPPVMGAAAPRVADVLRRVLVNLCRE